MKSKEELDALIADQEILLQTHLLKAIKSNETSSVSPVINTIITHKAQLINERNNNIKMAELTANEVDLGNKRINSFLRLEGIINGTVIYHFIKQDSDFNSVSSKIAYGSYKTVNTNTDLLNLALDIFKNKGY